MIPAFTNHKPLKTILSSIGGLLLFTEISLANSHNLDLDVDYHDFSKPFIGSGATVANSKLTSYELWRLRTITPYYSPYSAPLIQSVDTSFIPFGIIGNNDSEPVEQTTSFPARAIVQITLKLPNGYSRKCSGAMISKNMVLTAGHCVFRKTSTKGEDFKGDWVSDVLVFPGRNNDRKPYGTCKGIGFNALAGWIKPAENTKRQLYDLGAIKLDCSIGEKTGWFALSPFSKNYKVTINGYPCNVTSSSRQRTSEKKAVAKVSEFNLFYQNDTEGCMSGSPVFSGTHNIYGVHTTNFSETKDEPWKSNNSGTRLDNDIIKTIAKWGN